MQRRAEFMYGRRLARGPRGHVGTGLGKEPPFGGGLAATLQQDFRQPELVVGLFGQLFRGWLFWLRNGGFRLGVGFLGGDLRTAG